MQKESPQKEGLVGIFDILGYQYIIDNNQINYVAEAISNTLLDLPQEVVNKSFEIFKSTEGKADYFLSAIKENFQWRIFSDTILLSFPFYKDPPWTIENYIFFLSYTSLLLRSAFDAGLPLRGAIDCGEFYIKENCFAGNPIINSYRLSQELQISGCAMTESFQKRYSVHLRSFLKYNPIFVRPYLVPLKEKNPKRLYLIDWLCPLPSCKIPSDLRQYVAEKFYAHNKDIPREALPKLENTEMTLRYFLSKREEADRP